MLTNGKNNLILKNGDALFKKLYVENVLLKV